MKANKQNLSIVFGLLIFFGSTIASAEVFKWVDEQGNVHYGARPPTGKPANSVRIDAPPNPDPYLQQRREQMSKQLESWSEERSEKNKQRKEADEEKAAKKQRCANARSQLNLHMNSDRVYTMSPDGQRKYYNEEQRKQKIEQARKLIKATCS